MPQDVSFFATDGYPLVGTVFGPPRDQAPLGGVVIFPATTRLWRYFPAAAFGLGENIPAGVAREWASWGRAPGYVLDAEGGRFRSNYASLSLPMRSYSFSDDTFAPPSAVTALLDGFEQARLERRPLRPAELGRTAIGHWGFFREDLRDSLWVEAAGRQS